MSFLFTININITKIRVAYLYHIPTHLVQTLPQCLKWSPDATVNNNYNLYRCAYHLLHFDNEEDELTGLVLTFKG